MTRHEALTLGTIATLSGLGMLYLAIAGASGDGPASRWVAITLCVILGCGMIAKGLQLVSAGLQRPRYRREFGERIGGR
jgi:hypothetical protein